MPFSPWGGGLENAVSFGLGMAGRETIANTL
jgi:hypothetical protein